MGQCCSDDKEDSLSPKQGKKKEFPLRKYSYDSDRTVIAEHQKARVAQRSENVSDYECRNLSEGQTWIRLPGQVSDQRVTIENCIGGSIVVADQVDSIQGDDVFDCTMFLGPAMGSVFLRNFQRCNIVTACAQLRLRDCSNCRISLLTKTRPALENCRNIGLGCFCTAGYFCLREHMAAAKLSIMSNQFSNVHDFTPQQGNFYFMTIDECATIVPSLLPVSPNGELVTIEEDQLLRNDLLVPLSMGKAQHDNIAAIVVFAAGQYDVAERTSKQLNYGQLVYTLEKLFPEEDAKRTFGHHLKGRLREELIHGVVVCLAITAPIHPELREMTAVAAIIEGPDVVQVAGTVFLEGDDGFGQALGRGGQNKAASPQKQVQSANAVGSMMGNQAMPEQPVQQGASSPRTLQQSEIQEQPQTQQYQQPQSFGTNRDGNGASGYSPTEQQQKRAYYD